VRAEQLEENISVEGNVDMRFQIKMFLSVFCLVLLGLLFMPVQDVAYAQLPQCTCDNSSDSTCADGFRVTFLGQTGSTFTYSICNESNNPSSDCLSTMALSHADIIIIIANPSCISDPGSDITTTIIGTDGSTRACDAPTNEDPACNVGNLNDLLIKCDETAGVFTPGAGECVQIEIANLNNDIASIKADLKVIKSRPGAAPAPQPVIEIVVSIDDDPIKGDKNAPVTIIEFSDYECPFCKRSYDNVITQIDKEYISKGKVRLVFRDYPLPFHKKAIPAAVAANCAGEQGKYWEVHDFLFENPDKLDTVAVLNSAEEFGLDKTKFEACINDKSKEKEITKDFEDGQKYGVRGTPSYFIGKTTDGNEITGTIVRGAQPYSVFKELIEKHLKEVN